MDFKKWFVKEKMPRYVDRYAYFITAKKPFQRWVKNLNKPNPEVPDINTYKKIFLLPFDINSSDEDEACKFGIAVKIILLDIFSDFAADEKEVIDLPPERIFDWFSFEKVDSVMDYSSGKIRTYDYICY